MRRGIIELADRDAGAMPDWAVGSERMRDACKAAKKTCQIIVYPDTPHAFNADYRPSYRPEAAKDGWERMLAWFRTYGVV